MRLKYQKLIPVPVTNVVVDDEFWAPKLDVIQKETINDVFEKFHNDRGGAVENFDRVAKGESGYHAGPPWYDGLIWESMRGASDFLATRYDEALDQRFDDYIARMAAAQDTDPDGYLHTWVTLLSPETRWGKNGGNIVWQHDLYNAGCLIEAAVHHFQATGKITLLNIAVKCANYMADLMGPPPKENIVPAHALPEEAFIKLYQLFLEKPELREKFDPEIDEEKYLVLVKFWIDNRGNTEGRQPMGEYAQDHKPVVEMDAIVGHAVRASLLFCGLTTLAMATGEKAYFNTAKRVWENAVQRRMYITGSGGAHQHEEKFGDDYDLPNDGYLETCAAIAMAFWHHNMNLAFGEGKYIDELERALYNGILVGVSLKGDTYFYTNPLICKDHHRWDWHGCPCCPPMLLKVLGAMPSYIYAHDEEGLFVNLFVGSSAQITLRNGDVNIRQETRYPWDGKVKLSLESKVEGNMPLYVRVPGWVDGPPSTSDLYEYVDEGSGSMKFSVNGDPVFPEIAAGYAKFERNWQNGDVLEFKIPLPVRRVKSHEEVAANRGKIAITCGPLVYALEEIDNPPGVDQLFFAKDIQFQTEFQQNFLEGVIVVKGRAEEKVMHSGKSKATGFTAIPYYAQNNRGSGTMSVWVPDGKIPEFFPGSTIFLGELSVGLSISFRDRELYYTLDGSEPTKSSNRYESPILLTETTTVRACSFGSNDDISTVVSATFRRVTPRVPENPESATPGLQGKYYEGKWNKGVPSTEGMTPVSEEIVPAINLDITQNQHDFMVVFSGFLAVPVEGIYTFYLKAEGHSHLKIGDKMVVLNAGSSGMKEMSGKIALAPGKHALETAYCQKGGGKYLDVLYEGPGIEKQEIPATSLYTF